MNIIVIFFFPHCNWIVYAQAQPADDVWEAEWEIFVLVCHNKEIQAPVFE